MNTRILLLCYDFPPLNSAGALRPFSWYRDLHLYDIHPVVVTRHWDEGISKNEAKFTSKIRETEVNNNEFGTIIRAAYVPDSRTRLIDKHGMNKRVWLRKLITARNQFLGPFIKHYDEFHFLFFEADRYLKDNPVDLILATGSPFGLFKEAHQLSKKHKIPWIADYRDPFSFNVTVEQNQSWNLTRLFKAFMEKRWTRRIKHFTTVSEGWVQAISKHIGKKGSLIRNGYDEKTLPNKISTNKHFFQVTYLGTVYHAPYVNILSRGIEKFITEMNFDRKIQFQFIGLELNHTSGTDEIMRLASVYPENIIIRDACTNAAALQYAASSAVTLNLNYGRYADGVIPVKLYEYLALNKIILSIDTEYDAASDPFDRYIKRTQDIESFVMHLKDVYHRWKKGDALQNLIEKETLRKYSREEQTRKLAIIIKQIIKGH